MLQIFLKYKIPLLLLGIFITLYLIAINRGLELLYVIAELSLATLILSFIAPYFNTLGISVLIKHPKYSNQNQDIPITIELSSSSFFSKYFLEIWLYTPFTSKSSHMFFIKYLSKKLTMHTQISTDIRGVHQIGPVSIETAFPLGLNVVTKTFEDTKSEIVVFPSPFKVSNFPFFQDETSSHYGENMGKRKGGNDEFISVREYKQGDSPRHIHWPSSAKKGELIVREYQDILPSSLTIILDLNKKFNVISSLKETTLEYAINIASSLAIYALDQGYSVNLLGLGKDEIKLMNLKGSHNHIEILKTLAYAQCDGDETYHDTIQYFLNLQQYSGTLVLFDNGSENVEQEIDLYSLKFSKPILFDIQAESFQQETIDQEFSIQNNAKYIKYTLKKGCDIKRMFS